MKKITLLGLFCAASSWGALNDIDAIIKKSGGKPLVMLAHLRNAHAAAREDDKASLAIAIQTVWNNGDKDVSTIRAKIIEGIELEGRPHAAGAAVQEDVEESDAEASDAGGSAHESEEEDEDQHAAGAAVQEDVEESDAEASDAAGSGDELEEDDR